MVNRPHENHGHEEDEKPGIASHSRRRFLSTFAKGALVAGVLATGISMPKNADANDNDSGLNEAKRVLGLPKSPEKLSETEIGLMDTTLNSIFRHYMQPSFFLLSLPSGSKDEVKTLMKMVVRYHDKLQYEDNGNGVIKITKRQTKNPSAEIPDNFIMTLKNGVITRIGKYEVNLKTLQRWEDEWQEIQEKMEDINLRLFKKGAVTSSSEDRWYEFYVISLPKKLFELLKLKQEVFGLSKEEDDVYKVLKELPKKLGEKEIQFIVGRSPKTSKNPTPDYMVELLYPKGNPKEFETFAAFSFDGFVMGKKPKDTKLPEKEADIPKKITPGKALASIPGFETVGALLEKSEQLKSANKDNKSEKQPEMVWQKSSPSFANLYKEKEEKR